MAVGHSYGANGCGVLTIPTVITYFFHNFTATNDQWQWQTYFTDRIHNYTGIVGFTTDHGNHTMTEQFFAGGKPVPLFWAGKFHGVPVSSPHAFPNSSPVYTQVIDVNAANDVSGFAGPGQPLNSDIQARQFLDGYTDGDSGQIIWYGQDTKNIQFQYNMAAWPSALNVTDIAVIFAPLTPQQTVAFSPLGTIATIQFGQDTMNPPAIQLTASFNPVCSYGVPQIPSNQDNACSVIGKPTNNGTMENEFMVFE